MITSMTSLDSSLILFFITVFLLSTGVAENECSESRCGYNGPVVRFPFKLKNGTQQQYECAYPGFLFSCSPNNETVLELPQLPALQLLVRSIDYSSQAIQVYDPQNCLPEKLLRLASSSITPFQFGVPAYLNEMDPYCYPPNITLFDCSSTGLENPTYLYQDLHSCSTVAAEEYHVSGIVDILFCTKILYIPSVSVLEYHSPDSSLYLYWTKPDCQKCETEGKSCKLKNNGTLNETECFQHNNRKLITWITMGLSLGSITIILVVFALYRVQKYYMVEAEDQVRLEKFLQDYKVLKPTRFSYADIKRITNGFQEKLGEGSHGTVFKCKLSSDIVVAVKMLNNSKGNGQEFINEVGTMGKIHHVNVVRLVGFCADGYHRAIVYDYYPHGSLQNFLSSPDDRKVFLGWEKLQGVALGIAKGIEYLHQGCEQRILHFDINPHNVLLDNNNTPKITDFGLAKLCSRDRSTVSVTAAKGTLGYIAPEVFSRNFGNGSVSYKSDVYSYGILLLEMVGGRKNMEQTGEQDFHVLYPEWIHSLLEGKDIHIAIGNDDDIRIAKKIATVGLWCIQWHPVDRPSMNSVLQMLEGEGDISLPRNPLDKTRSRHTSTSAAGRRRLGVELEVIEESQ